MKMVKKCPNCSYYNPHNVLRCQKCNTYIDKNTQIESIDNDILYAIQTIPNEIKIKEEEIYTCPYCLNTHDKPVLRCQNCGRPIIDLPLKNNKTTTDLKEQSLEVIAKLDFDLFTINLNHFPYHFGWDYVEEDLVKNNEHISGKHFLIEFSDSTFHIIDLSTNGTSLNGKKIIKNQKTLLHDKDIIGIPFLSGKFIICS